MLSLFDFGKKRRSTRRKVSRKGRKGRKGTRKGARKPPARLLKICKKYRVKTTRKVGGKRVYRPAKMLAKLCLKKAMAKKRKSRKVRRSGFGNKSMMMNKDMKPPMGFGKRRGRKVSKASAMKAFRSFYKRHCAGMRRSRFGNGGNPPLMNSMGYEFCPSGMGGVLGANSTGLFPSPCTSMNAAQSQVEGAATGFGRRRSRRRYMAAGKRRSAVGTRTRRRSAVGARTRRRSAVGTRTRRRSAVGARRRRRSAVGARTRRRSAVGARRSTRRA